MKPFLIRVIIETVTDDINENYPLSFGALYLYAKYDSGTVSDIIAGFWQNS